jgi:4-aminobutyrate aminotransferase/(S)-3-amino-2-methylpropionate transaminase
LTTALLALQRQGELARIRNIRGRGAMIAFDLGEPGTDLAQRVARRAAQNGLILLTCGVFGTTIRILVPLTASDTVVDEGLAILAGALRDVQA